MSGRNDGRPGTKTNDTAGFAAFAPTDLGFGGCLGIQKIFATNRLRWMGEVPIQPGTGPRPGVNMVWPTNVAITHFGIDLTGSTGGVVRVDDIIIANVTNFYAADLLGIVDPRDCGAVGIGVTNHRGLPLWQPWLRRVSTSCLCLRGRISSALT